MRWLADECIAPEIVRALRHAGHDVVSTLERFPSSGDAFVLEFASQEGRILLTEDNDFGELVFRNVLHTGLAGVVLIRMPSERKSLKLARLIETVDQYGQRLTGSFVVVGETRTRARSLPGK